MDWRITFLANCLSTKYDVVKNQVNQYAILLPKILLPMKKIFFFLFAVGFLFTSEITAQNVTIDSNFRIIATQAASNGVYTVNINSANFSSEQKAKQVFNFFSKHPALSFDLNYADGQVLMKVSNLSSLSRGTVDLNYLNGVLKRRSMAYQRLF